MLKNPIFWVAVIAVILLLFGASRLPDIASNIGKSMKVFKKEIKELTDDNEDGTTSSTVNHTSSTESTLGATTNQQPINPTSEHRRDETPTT